jgi:hypothetical protein
MGGMTYDTIPEGASRRYRFRVPDGAGGWKPLTGYAITGEWRTGPDAVPTVIAGAVEADPNYGYVDLLPAHTTGGGVRYLDLKAALGTVVHIATVQVRVANR